MISRYAHYRVADPKVVGYHADLCGRGKHNYCSYSRLSNRPPCTATVTPTWQFCTRPPLRQRLVLHRATIDTAAGREAFLRCLVINKLECLALGACTWFDDAVEEPEDARRKELRSGRWWGAVCDTIRTSGFRLQELVFEGIDEGELNKRTVL